MPLHIETPLIASQALSTAAGCSVWLKLEALQAPGSFKIRGIGAACEEYSRRGARRFVSSSGAMPDSPSPMPAGSCRFR